MTDRVTIEKAKNGFMVSYYPKPKKKEGAKDGEMLYPDEVRVVATSPEEVTVAVMDALGEE